MIIEIQFVYHRWGVPVFLLKAYVKVGQVLESQFNIDVLWLFIFMFY